MNFQFKEINNQDSIHNDKSIRYFSNLTFNSNERIILDIIIETLRIANKENRKKYIFKLKEYYSNKGVIFDNAEFEMHVDNFLNENIGNIKGAFLEVLSLMLISSYCNYDELYKECIVTLDDNHPYDIVTIRGDSINLIDIKFSCYHLNRNHLEYLVKYNYLNNVESYLISFDSFSQIIHKLESLKYQNKISDEEFENFINEISFVSSHEIYDSILNNKCLIN